MTSYQLIDSVLHYVCLETHPIIWNLHFIYHSNKSTLLWLINSVFYTNLQTLGNRKACWESFYSLWGCAVWKVVAKNFLSLHGSLKHCMFVCAKNILHGNNKKHIHKKFWECSCDTLFFFFCIIVHTAEKYRESLIFTITIFLGASQSWKRKSHPVLVWLVEF